MPKPIVPLIQKDRQQKKKDTKQHKFITYTVIDISWSKQKISTVSEYHKMNYEVHKY